MPRSYLRLIPDFFERKAAGTERRPAYPPAAIAALVGVFCLAEQQPERGRFKSRRVLQVLLEETGGKVYGKQVAFLLKNEDLVELSDGTIYVDGWDELQEGDFKVQERMRRYRQRKADATATVTQSVTETVTPPLENRNGHAPSGGGRRLAVAVDGPPSPDHGGGAPPDTPPQDVAEIRDMVLAALPTKFGRDPATWGEAEQLAWDFQGQHAVVGQAIAEHRRSGSGPPFPQKLREYLPRLQPEKASNGVDVWSLFENLDEVES